MNVFTPWHSLSVPQTLRRLQSSSRGLLEKEAKKRLEQIGPNIQFQPALPPPLWSVFFTQWKSPLMIGISSIAILALATGNVVLSWLLFMVAVGNALAASFLDERLRYLQEFMRSIVHSLSLVRRLSKPKSLSAVQLRRVSEVVPGDIVILSSGDAVPADGRIVSSVDFQVDESTLTGESYPQTKGVRMLPAATSLLDRSNMVFSRSLVTRGSATVAITATGIQTVVGSIGVEQKQCSKPITPIVKEWNQLHRWIVVGCAVAVIMLAAVGRIQGIPMWQLVPLLLTVGVLAFPQWLLSSASVIFAEAAQHLVQMGTIVKHAAYSDTLGRCTVLCIDKTATITKGALAIEMLVVGINRAVLLNQLNRGKNADGLVLAEALLLCNDARRTAKHAESSRISAFVGDSTDSTIAQSFERAGLDKEHVDERNIRVRVFPFSTDSKMMVTAHRKKLSSTGTLRVVAKGAPERILERCSFMMVEKKRIKLTDSLRRTITASVEEYSSKGYRIIGVAQGSAKSERSLPRTIGDLRGLGWVGFAVLSDPIRPESRMALDELRSYGVRVLLVTGDHPANAQTVARLLSLPTPDPIVGGDIEALSDEQLLVALNQRSVFARVEPRQKERIVETLQKAGEVVAMTGDGMNDVFALKKSDIGIAVANATDIARDAADILITSQNLFSITSMIREGRRVVSLMRTLGLFTLSTSVMLVGVLISRVWTAEVVFGPQHIIWMTMLVYLIPLLFLMSDRAPATGSIESSIFSRRLLIWALSIGLLFALSIIGSILLMSQAGADPIRIRSVAWVTAAILPLALLLSWSVQEGLVKTIQHKRWLILGIGGSVVVQALTLFDPWLKYVFGVAPLPGSVVAGIAFGFLFVLAIRHLMDRQWALPSSCGAS